MGYRQSKSRTTGTRKPPREKKKSKSKTLKPRVSRKLQPLEEPEVSPQEVAEKACSGLDKLGTQVFALSPFSQYYDDWLMSLRQVLSEFEANPAITIDEEFVKTRTQILTDIERALAENRLKDESLEESASKLAENNHLLVQLDADFASNTHELSAKRNKQNEELTEKVRDLEYDLETVEQTKTTLFFGFTKKAKAKKEAEVTQNLNAAKKELEMALQGFDVEQEKLHDEYEKRKAATIAEVQRLEKEIANIETDRSKEARQEATAALAEAVKALPKRVPASSA